MSATATAAHMKTPSDTPWFAAWFDTAHYRRLYAAMTIRRPGGSSID